MPLHAQTPAATPPGTDVILFTNGDQLTGKLLREVGGSVIFHSDIAGDVTVTWDKIKSIHTGQQFAVIQQGQHVTRKTADADIVQGNVQVEDDQVKVTQGTSGASKDIPVKNAQYVIDKDTYTKELRGNPGFFSGWNGSLTAGATLVEATQNSRNFTGNAALVRAIPSVNWLDPRDRTIFDFTGAYGQVTQPGTAGTKTNIIHFDAEHDWFFSPRFYFLVDASWDHNYSQGLSLQQVVRRRNWIHRHQGPEAATGCKAGRALRETAILRYPQHYSSSAPHPEQEFDRNGLRRHLHAEAAPWAGLQPGSGDHPCVQSDERLFGCGYCGALVPGVQALRL